MHLASVRYIRRSLLWIIILVVLIVLADYFYSSYNRRRAGTGEFPLLSSDMVQFSEGAEYADTEDGILRFKIRAKQLIEIQAGKIFLQGIEAFDFNPDGIVHNKIHSLKAEYDRQNRTVDFKGDVQLFLGNEIELRTESLHYDMNANIGTTPRLGAILL